MRSWLRARLSRKIILSVLLVVTVLMLGFAAAIVAQRGTELEQQMFAKARTDAMVGAQAVQTVLEAILRNNELSVEQLFSTDYQLIESGPLAGSQIPKYSTPYDTLLDQRIRLFEDSFFADESIVYAVLVDRKGYLPTHNTRYSHPLTGDPLVDVTGNRTKRIFNDPVGLRAASYSGQDGKDVLRQVYHRDTGVTMWDVTAPVFVSGEHWGGFRIGLSMAQIEAQILTLRNTVLAGAGVTLFFACLTIWWAVAGTTGRLDQITKEVDKISLDGRFKTINIDADDEIGILATAFNRMMTSLKEANVGRDYLDRILDSMNDSLMVVNTQGVVLKANRATFALLDHPEKNLVGQSIEMVFAERRSDAISWFDHIVDSRAGQQIELEYRSRHGRTIPVLFSSAPLMNDDDGCEAIICLAQDITERKTAEEKIRNAKQFLETVLDSLNEEMTILDAQSLVILKANKAFCDAYGKTAEELIGQTCHSVTHGLPEPCNSMEHFCPAVDVLEYGQVESCEHQHTGAEGKRQFVDIQVTPVFDDTGKPEYLIHMARDITMRKNVEIELQHFTAELEENNRALAEKTAALEEAHMELKASHARVLQQEKMASIGQLSAGVAHEINNPIGFISSNLVTLRKYSSRLVEYLGLQDKLWLEKGKNEIGEELSEKRKKLKLDYIARDLEDLISESLDGADRVKQIVLDLKGFARADEKDCTEVDLHECLESTLNIARNEIKYKATVDKDYGHLPRIKCYPQQINQVFMNLLVNAAQAINDQGAITIKTWNGDGRVHVSVSDNGCGIPEDVQKRIFEPFFTTKDVGKGTGLGLSISYDIIKKHHGEITIESDPGNGTTFTVHLPLSCEEAVPC